MDWCAGGWKKHCGLTALTLAAAGILGYHPYSEDGGIYLAEIKRALDPGLYPYGREFVAGHLGWSGFTAGVVAIVRVSGWRLEWVMLCLYFLSLWGLLIGVCQLAGRMYGDSRAQWGATGLVALCLTMPIAGTSLLLMDPYVTARSVCLALTLLGMSGVVHYRVDQARKGRLAWGLIALGGAVAVHPLMGGYGVGAVWILGCVLDRRRWVRVGGVVGLALAAFVMGRIVQDLAQGETGDYVRVAATRYYWFLGEWQWYEWIGVVAPVGILVWVGWRRGGSPLERGMAQMGVCLGGIGMMVAGVYAREGGRVHAVARMQPLRCFQVVYVVLLMVIGGWVGERVLRGSVWRWGVAMALLGGGMLYVERATYPGSGHLEVPGVRVVNQWEEAFVWVKGNTPRDALFGLDADYVHRAGEDAQGFRAVAERSVLPDYSKDGGQAAIRPELTEAWVVGQSGAGEADGGDGCGAGGEAGAAGGDLGCDGAGGADGVCLSVYERVGDGVSVGALDGSVCATVKEVRERSSVGRASPF